MRPVIKALRDNIAALERELQSEKRRLEQVESTCQHRFGGYVADHVRHEAYEIPGDRPGTMGVDYRGSCYVPARTEERWKRECELCGKVERTSRTQEKITRVPSF